MMTVGLRRVGRGESIYNNESGDQTNQKYFSPKIASPGVGTPRNCPQGWGGGGGGGGISKP